MLVQNSLLWGVLHRQGGLCRKGLRAVQQRREAWEPRHRDEIGSVLLSARKRL